MIFSLGTTQCSLVESVRVREPPVGEPATWVALPFIPTPVGALVDELKDVGRSASREVGNGWT